MSKTETNPSRPRLFWPSAFALLCFAALIGLGVWQLIRLDWKRDLMSRAEIQLAQPAIPLPDRLDQAGTEFQRVVVVGEFPSGIVLFRPGGSPSDHAGLRGLTALTAEEGGLTLLVDLGWIAIDQKGADIALPTGQVRVDGVLRVPEPVGWLTAANDPEGNLWQSFDMPAMAESLGVAALAPIFVQAETIVDQDGQPVLADSMQRGPISINIRNNHLQYALTWFALACGLLAIYVIFVRRAYRDRGRDQS